MTTYTIPPKPKVFAPDKVAPGCGTKFVPIARDVSPHRIRMCVIHTNWAEREGSIQSAYNWSMAAPGKNTIAHYQHDRNGDAAKLLATNKRGIGNSGVRAHWASLGMPDAAWWALTFETADRGTLIDPAPVGSYFTDPQLAALARDVAYECVLHDIDPVWPTDYRATGIITHTDPWPYPYFTTANGKRCPGTRKVEQVREELIPWVQAIVNAWTAKPAPTPTPPPAPPNGDDMRPIGLFQLVDDAGAPRSPYVLVVGDPSGFPLGKHVKRSVGLPLVRQWLRERGLSDQIIKLTDEAHFRALGPVLHPEAPDVWFDGDAVKRP